MTILADFIKIKTLKRTNKKRLCRGLKYHPFTSSTELHFRPVHVRNALRTSYVVGPIVIPVQCIDFKHILLLLCTPNVPENKKNKTRSPFNNDAGTHNNI